METSLPSLTVTASVPATGCPATDGPVLVAEMVAAPTPTAVTRPADAAVFETVATVVLSEAQVTALLGSTAVPSLKVPVAVSASVVPFSMVVEVAVVTAIDFRTASVTVRATVPVTFWVAVRTKVTVIMLVPLATGVTFPFEPGALEIVATVVVADVQVTLPVRSCLLPSEYVAWAARVNVVPSATVGAAGLMSIVCGTAFETTKVAVAVTGLVAPKEAVMTVEPSATPLARPLLPAALEMVAAAGVADVQATVSVRSCRVASVKKPVAVNCCMVPAAMVKVAGVTTIETSVSFETVSVRVPLMAAAPVPI